MKNETIVKLSKNFKFTEAHLETAKSFINKEAYPEFYGDELPKGLEFVDTYLVDTDSITRSSPELNSQYVRHGGVNLRHDDLLFDLSTHGLRLNCRPISIVECGDGSYTFLDGRTKDSILEYPNFKVKNRIVNLYRFTTKDKNAQKYAELTFGLVANKEGAPAGVVKLDDVISVGKKMIADNLIANELEDIRSWVNTVGQDFSYNKKELMLSLIYEHSAYKARTGREVKGWKSQTVESWLKSNKYIDTSTVIYMPVSYSTVSKSIFMAAEKALLNPNKEIRVVIHTGILSGASLENTYIKRVVEFKKAWYTKLQHISSGFFDNKTASDFKIKLYGVLPANLEELCPDDGKLIVFGKNDQNVNPQYITDSKLKSKLIDGDYGLDEDEDDIIEA